MIVSPSGKTFVCENETGAIVGNTFEQVKEDVKQGTLEDMQEQIKEAKKLVSKGYHAPIEEMWHRLKAA